MFNPTSSITINNIVYILFTLFIASTFAFVIHLNDQGNNYKNRQFGFDAPTSYERSLRTIKFPRIGRSTINTNHMSSNIYSNLNSEENLIDRRSVFFPRIGKRTWIDRHYINNNNNNNIINK